MEDYLVHGPYLRADIEERVADALCLPAGENAPLRLTARNVEGSPPRVRGKPNPPPAAGRGAGITPARAGKTR